MWTVGEKRRREMSNVWVSLYGGEEVKCEEEGQSGGPYNVNATEAFLHVDGLSPVIGHFNLAKQPHSLVNYRKHTRMEFPRFLSHSSSTVSTQIRYVGYPMSVMLYHLHLIIREVNYSNF